MGAHSPSFLNRKAVKIHLKNNGKRCAKEFIEVLNRKVSQDLDGAIKNASGARTIKSGDLPQ